MFQKFAATNIYRGRLEARGGGAEGRCFAAPGTHARHAFLSNRGLVQDAMRKVSDGCSNQFHRTVLNTTATVNNSCESHSPHLFFALLAACSTPHVRLKEKCCCSYMLTPFANNPSSFPRMNARGTFRSDTRPSYSRASASTSRRCVPQRHNYHTGDT